MELCFVDGCLNPARKSGLCWKHIKQKARGQQLRIVERLTPKERVMSCVFTWLDADAEDDRVYDLAERRFWDACDALYLSAGWTPPAKRSSGA
jgi:hypothetical protein